MQEDAFNPLCEITAVIPSLNPDKKLIDVALGVSKAGFGCVVFIDDGSDEGHKHFFDEAAALCPNSVLLRHSRNLGKGRALKTAFNYFLESRKSDIGLVTIDGDNQHYIDDIIATAQRLYEKPDSLVLGCRSFNQDGVPKKSSFGNKATAFFIRLLCGINISDTQTGLRGISSSFVYKLLSVSGERFDFETNMLIEAKQNNIPFEEVKIRTIYFDDNVQTHFNPLRDSILIYKLIFKFFGSGIASTLLDFLIFLLINNALFSVVPREYSLLIATISARLCSSLFNYFVNKNLVFGNRSTPKTTIIKYYTLCLIQTGASYGGVLMLSRLVILPDFVSKLIVDTVLFFISFQIQREVVFKVKKT